MFYKMITQARDRWYESDECKVSDLIEYIIQTNKMRDAQIDAIKTYLFLKIACENKPLSVLFNSGKFNSLNLDELAISSSLRTYFKENPAAAALYEYAVFKDDSGKQVSGKLERKICEDPESINYSKVFEEIFYNVTYTDYLFSLPMGAGKTFLMAAFIYLDLYFASNEPDNKAFAHNFIIFAPSGLKSSVIPSLKTIQKFDPTWILPEPSASEIKRKLIFEVLDATKSENKSNKTKNPNVQKIANHQPLSELFGLVAVTNAEKVILDRIEEKDGQINLFEDSNDERDKKANELRNLIGKLPSLSIFIDEVHHAVSDEIKLRAVVNKWVKTGEVNSVIGFSGTPYLEKAEGVKITDNFSVKSSEISNVVFYYPLIRGVGNFLKTPIVKIPEFEDSTQIIEAGVREFLDLYLDKVYPGGLTAKLGIYCGSIKKLEEVVYPLVRGIAGEYGLSENSILRFYRKSSVKGEKQYVAPADSQMYFDTLDSSISPIRIILLVQIGKEGWDCRSLTGIILSQEGDCPKNMVLQTSCRCLRQVERESSETALIYLNESNAKKLNSQLEQQQHISLQELSNANNNDNVLLNRYDRTKYLRLPNVEFYQMQIHYETVEIEPANPSKGINDAIEGARKNAAAIITTDLTMKNQNIEFDDEEHGKDIASFNTWIYSIVKDSFETLSMDDLKPYTEELKTIFEEITYENQNNRYFSSKYDIKAVNANIRKAFCDKRDFTEKDEEISESASLLNITNFTSLIYTDHPEDYYPDQENVEKIILDDQGKLEIDDKTKQLIELAEETGKTQIADELRKENASHPQKDRSFHYLPYHTDSGFEQTFLDEILSYSDIIRLGLEVYYNGDKTMTEFKIKCYKKTNSKWTYLGLYTPDFLIIQRRDGQIYKAIIVETKGEIYAHDPKFNDKKKFVESDFIIQNNKAFGYKRFDYLYLEDTLSDKERLNITHQEINDFFKED